MASRPIVSIGSFCATRRAIWLAGVRQPTFPFDDIFSNIGMTTECLSDRFEGFLNFSKMEKIGDDDHRWLHVGLAPRYGLHETIAHQNMSDPEIREKFKRRVDRFLNIRRNTFPLFVFHEYGDRIESAVVIDKLHEALCGLFGKVPMLVILIGGDDQRKRVGDPKRRGILLRWYDPISPIIGTDHSDGGEQELLVGLVRKGIEQTGSSLTARALRYFSGSFKRSSGQQEMKPLKSDR